MDFETPATVVVTRAEESGGPLSSMLRNRGARVLNWPTVRYEPPGDSRPLENALQRLDIYDWIVLSSPRAVEALVRLRPVLPEALRVAVVGVATAFAAETAGWPVHLVPDGGTAHALVEAFRRLGRRDGRVFFPASDIARSTLRQGLGDLGFQVDQIEAYRTVGTDLERQRCLADVGRYRPDVVTFASPSAVESLHRVLGADAFDQILADAPPVAIGPVTAEALEEAGRPPVGIADKHTLQGLVAAVEQTVDRLKNTKEA